MTVPAVPVLPWIPPAVRALLLADATFNTACGGRCGTRAGDATKPYALVRATAIPRDTSAGVWSPLVQVDGWCGAGASSLDPEEAAWQIAVSAARVLARARNVTWQNIRYSARVTDGPIPDIDTSRGSDNPMYRALIRAELTVHAR